ncbi:MAG: hypothetical protein H0W06_12155 [Chloroflexia bacterium]|nr:hypothetical protein [Chloroflexia bacterium]
MTSRPRRLIRSSAWPVAALAFVLASLIGSYGSVAAQSEDAGVVGSWSIPIADSDVPTDLGGGPNLIGRWRVEFRDDGTYAGIREDIGQVVGGSWEVDGDQLTITDETGPSSCAAPQPGSIDTEDAASGMYRWERAEDRLTLEAVEESCALRQLLLTTRPLVVYMPCTTEPYPLAQSIATADADEDVAARLTDATPAASPVPPEASPVESDGADASDAAPGGTLDPEEAIDALLVELTACWATGDPARVLPLFSQVFLDDLVASGPPGTTIVDVAALFRDLLAAPVTFERAGDVETDGPRRAQAEVRLSIGEEESTQRLDFVLEGGAWKLADLGVPAA